MLRNCLKKGFRPVAVLAVAVLMCSLGGCSDSESGLSSEYTVRHLAEWCGIRKREAKNSLQRLLESNIPYGDDSITCADSRRFAYQTIIDRCEEEDKEVRK